MKVQFSIVWIGPVRYVMVTTPKGHAFVRGVRK